MERMSELEYLRYFYDRVDTALGPASDDVYGSISDAIQKKLGMRLPEGYDDEEDT